MDAIDEEAWLETVRQQLESDDPALDVLVVSDDVRSRGGPCPLAYRPYDGDWEKFGNSIGAHTHLNTVIFQVEDITDEDADIFFRGFSANGSIKELVFSTCIIGFGLSLSGERAMLDSFFRNSTTLESLGINNYHLDLDCCRLITSALTGFCSLKKLRLYHCRIDGNGFREITQALGNHLNLTQAQFSNNTVYGGEYFSLLPLLINSICKLEMLDLSWGRIGDKEAASLATCLAGNSTLRTVRLLENRAIRGSGWQTIFRALRSPCCRLDTLDVRQNSINNRATTSLANSLSKGTTLRVLHLRHNSCKITVWKKFFSCLRSSNCVLKELNVARNRLNDDEVIHLAKSLSRNNSLKSLDLAHNDVSVAGISALLNTGKLETLEMSAVSSLATPLENDRTLKSLSLITNRGITVAELRTLSNVLQNPLSRLEKLCLVQVGVDDEVMTSLTNALADNNRLKELEISGNSQITSRGWETFSAVLGYPSSVLEKLELGGEISNSNLISFGLVLTNNDMLRELILYSWRGQFAPEGSAVFLQLLCNELSIMDIYRSNHTLENLDYQVEETRRDLEDLLRINRENSKSQAARLKIMKYLFKDGFSVDPFLDLELSILPHAIAWMGRDSRQDEVDERFYSFLRSMPLWFDVGRKG